jgi:hypothetical protein
MTGPWVTNATHIIEDVTVPFHTVVWYIEHWDHRYPVIYGDDDALFIFDHERMLLHAFTGPSYMCHTIESCEEIEGSVTAFLVTMAPITALQFIHYFTPEEWMYMRSLVTTCPRGRDWLTALRTTLLH